MTDKKSIKTIKDQAKTFSEQFLSYLSETLNSFEKVQPEIRNAMPSIFNSKDITINIYYSENREHIMLLFTNHTKNTNFTFNSTNNNIFDILDDTKTREKKTTGAFTLTDSSGIIDSIYISNQRKPFEIKGSADFTILNISFLLPNENQQTIPFGYIRSYSIFQERQHNIEQYIKNMIYSLWDYYRQHNKQMFNKQENSKEYKIQIAEIIKKMKELFFNDEIEEKLIDEFITNNPIILEQCLDIKPDSLISQQKLNNIIKTKFEQDLIPDGICQNIYGDWIIIDYKRAKRILKKLKTARADITAEVTELKTQIKNYREYFNEDTHRQDFHKQTGFIINPKPQGIGIIGNIQENERQIFKDSIEDYPNRIKICTYNDLFEKFNKYYKDLP